MTSFFNTLVLPVAESALLNQIYKHAVRANENIDTKGILVIVDNKTGDIRITAMGQFVKE